MLCGLHSDVNFLVSRRIMEQDNQLFLCCFLFLLRKQSSMLPCRRKIVWTLSWSTTIWRHPSMTRWEIHTCTVQVCIGSTHTGKWKKSVNELGMICFSVSTMQEKKRTHSGFEKKKQLYDGTCPSCQITISDWFPNINSVEPQLFCFFMFCFQLYNCSWAIVLQGFWRSVFHWTLASFSLTFSPVLVPGWFHSLISLGQSTKENNTYTRPKWSQWKNGY